MKKEEEDLIAKVLSQPDKYKSYQDDSEQCVWVEVESRPMGSLVFIQYGIPSLIIKDLLAYCNKSAYPTIRIWSYDKARLLNEYVPANKSITTPIFVGVKLAKRLLRKPKSSKVVTPWTINCPELINKRQIIVTFTGQSEDIILANNAINSMNPYEEK